MVWSLISRSCAMLATLLPPRAGRGPCVETRPGSPVVPSVPSGVRHQNPVIQTPWNPGRARRLQPSQGDSGALKSRSSRSGLVSGPLRAAGPTQPLGAHQPVHGAPGDPVAATVELGVHLPDPVGAVVVRVNPPDHRQVTLFGDRPQRGWTGLGGVVAARGDRHPGLACAHRQAPSQVSITTQPRSMRLGGAGLTLGSSN